MHAAIVTGVSRGLGESIAANLIERGCAGREPGRAHRPGEPFLQRVRRREASASCDQRLVGCCSERPPWREPLLRGQGGTRDADARACRRADSTRLSHDQRAAGDHRYRDAALRALAIARCASLRGDVSRVSQPGEARSARRHSVEDRRQTRSRRSRARADLFVSGALASLSLSAARAERKELRAFSA